MPGVDSGWQSVLCKSHYKTWLRSNYQNNEKSDAGNPILNTKSITPAPCPVNNISIFISSLIMFNISANIIIWDNYTLNNAPTPPSPHSTGSRTQSQPSECGRQHLWIAYMLKQLLGSSLMEILKPGCLRNVESGETSLSWLYPRSIGSQCKIKDQRYCVGS